MENNWIKDEIVLVTGGGSGIGRAIAIEAARRGAIVVVADINQEMGEETESLICNLGYICQFFPTDVTNKKSVEKLISDVSKIGNIHFLVNSAGLQTYGTVENTSEETWDKTLDVNLKSIYLVSHQVITQMKNNGDGAIVNISSLQGIRSQKNVSAYATSKAGVIALTRSMGLDFASLGVRINAICPGSVDTPLLRFSASNYGDVNETLKKWAAGHPIGRIGTAEEIAKIALFLMSPDAGFIVGQAIVADGGLGSGIL